MAKLTYHATKECIRCGTCCRKGGPVLHHEDKKILLHHQTLYAHLVTIRRGELTYNPVSELVEPARQEMIKVSGKGDDWTCFFYGKDAASCAIYDHRFLECRVLRCWQPDDIMGIVGRNILRRLDIINHNDPVLEIIEMHEKECSLQELKTLTDQVSTGKENAEALRKISGLLQQDRAIRSHAFSDLGLSRDYELFIFGRPLTNVLKDFGLSLRT
jgi:Fe-S-cluster containining protein